MVMMCLNKPGMHPSYDGPTQLLRPIFSCGTDLFSFVWLQLRKLFQNKNFHYFACMETLIYHVIQYKFFLLINNGIVLNNSI